MAALEVPMVPPTANAFNDGIAYIQLAMTADKKFKKSKDEREVRSRRRLCGRCAAAVRRRRRSVPALCLRR